MLPDLAPDDLRFAASQTRLKRAANEEIAERFMPIWEDRCRTDRPVLDDGVILMRPVRRVLTRSAARPTGYFSSVKNDAVVAWESTLERDAIRRLECDPSVSAYWTQPLTISYLDPWAGSRRVYTPDLFVARGEQSILIEVKARARATRSATARLLEYFGMLFEGIGVVYRVWDEAIIREEPAFSDACWLLRYRSQRVAFADRMSARRLLERHGILPLSRLAEHLGPDGRNRIYALLLRGDLRSLGNASLRENPSVMLAGSAE